MANHDSSITEVLRDAVRDAQDLVRGEIALAKAEAREEASRFGFGAALLAGAAVTAVIALVLLMTTLAWAISEVSGWPVWAGFGSVTVLTVLIAAALGMVGRQRLTAARHMPRTVDTLKESLQWMRARTS